MNNILEQKIFHALEIVKLLNIAELPIYRNNIPDGDEPISTARNQFANHSFNESQWVPLSCDFKGVALVGNVVFDNKYLTYSGYYNMLSNLSADSVIFFS